MSLRVRQGDSQPHLQPLISGEKYSYPNQDTGLPVKHLHVFVAFANRTAYQVSVDGSMTIGVLYIGNHVPNMNGQGSQRVRSTFLLY